MTTKATICMLHYPLTSRQAGRSSVSRHERSCQARHGKRIVRKGTDHDDDQASQHPDPPEKEDFAPIDPANVRMYVCGPTVYDRAHLGNARPVVVFDTLYRLLRHVYGADHVTYVRNFTDVDDKINAEACAPGGGRARHAGGPDPRAHR